MSFTLRGWSRGPFVFPVIIKRVTNKTTLYSRHLSFVGGRFSRNEPDLDFSCRIGNFDHRCRVQCDQVGLNDVLCLSISIYRSYLLLNVTCATANAVNIICAWFSMVYTALCMAQKHLHGSRKMESWKPLQNVGAGTSTKDGNHCR